MRSIFRLCPCSQGADNFHCKCCSMPENVFLIVCGPLLELMFNAPSDSDGGLPLAIRHFWEIPWILTRLPPDQLDTMSYPLIMNGLLLEMSFHLRWFCSLRGFQFIEYPLWKFLCCRTISHMQKMTFKNAKLMYVLKFWKCIFSKQQSFVRLWIQLRIYSKPYRSQDILL